MIKLNDFLLSIGSYSRPPTRRLEFAVDEPIECRVGEEKEFDLDGLATVTATLVRGPLQSCYFKRPYAYVFEV